MISEPTKDDVMSDMRIDERSAAAFVLVDGLSVEDFDWYMRWLPLLRAGEETFARQVASTTGLKPIQASEIYDMSIQIGCASRNTSKILRDLLEAAVASIARQGNALTEPERAMDRLEQMVLHPDTRLRTEAICLVMSSESLLADVSIVPDLRHIMLDDHPDDVSGLIVIHSLRITTVAPNGERRDTYVSLANGGLQAIRAKIDKAIAQEDSLVTAMLNKGMVLIGWDRWDRSA